MSIPFYPNGGGEGVVNVPGSAIQISPTSISCRRVNITAHIDNSLLTPVDGDSGVVLVVGASNTIANKANRVGVPLYATQSTWFEVADVSLLWADSNAVGAKFSYYYEL